MSGGRPLRRLLRTGLVTLVVVAVVGAVAAAALQVAGAGQGAGAAPTAKVNTAKVTRKTLVDSVAVDGKIGYGAATPVASKATGTVTWLPAPGSLVTRGEALLRADNRPVALLYGALPMFRELATGAEGDDVTQLKDNLKALKLGKLTTTAKFDATTEAAVKRWQKVLKRDESGKLAVADVIYAPGPLRIATRTARIGGSAAADILTATTTTKVVTADVPSTEGRLAQVHNAVTVTLPDGKQVKGEVSQVGTGGGNGEPGTGSNQSASAANGSGGGGADGGGNTVSVVVDIADQKALGKADTGAVRVQYVAATHPGVLTVPVEALVALAEGGFGLEIRESGAPRVVAVKTGLFGGGQVEVSGQGIAEGKTVGVAG
ncbi:MAG: hypothetical protein JWO79_4191 [Actinomycetia bacterium]|nr:hypothetical protein [Actinomycetes bacterium]